MRSKSSSDLAMRQLTAQKGSLGGRVVFQMQENPIKSTISIVGILGVVGTVIAAALKVAVVITFFATPWGWITAAVVVVVALAVLFAWKVSAIQMEKALVENIVKGIKEQNPLGGRSKELGIAIHVWDNGEESGLKEGFAKNVRKNMKQWPVGGNETELWQRITAEFVCEYQSIVPNPQGIKTASLAVHEIWKTCFDKLDSEPFLREALNLYDTDAGFRQKFEKSGNVTDAVKNLTGCYHEYCREKILSQKTLLEEKARLLISGMRGSLVEKQDPLSALSKAYEREDGKGFRNRCQANIDRAIQMYKETPVNWKGLIQHFTEIYSNWMIEGIPRK